MRWETYGTTSSHWLSPRNLPQVDLGPTDNICSMMQSYGLQTLFFLRWKIFSSNESTCGNLIYVNKPYRLMSNSSIWIVDGGGGGRCNPTCSSTSPPHLLSYLKRLLENPSNPILQKYSLANLSLLFNKFPRLLATKF